jgi:copper chaperone
MPTFRIPDMSCGHCVAAITQAVQQVDAAARVEADLALHEVHIEAATADAQTLAAAIAAAGYTPALQAT